MFDRIFKIDWFLVFATLLIISVSLVILYSISSSGQDAVKSVFTKQSVYVLIGIGALLFFAFTNYHYFKTYSTKIYFLMLAILVVTLMFGKTVRGMSGWIGLGLFQVQPAEMAKLALIIFLASFISQKRSELVGIVRLIASFVLSGAMMFLVLLQPDFGSAMVLAGIWLGMNLVGGIEKKHLAGLLIIGLVVSAIGWSFLAPYQKDRMYTFVRPDADPKGSGYNVIQSIIAVGSGGMFGKGVGHGSQSQLNFLPERHNDFIFAVVCEELGFFGGMFLLGLLFLLLYRMKAIAGGAGDNFGFLLAAGILVKFFIEIVVNVGMTMGLLPVTGIPLPMVSYGGSALVTSCVAIGILLNIHSNRKRFETPSFKRH